MHNTHSATEQYDDMMKIASVDSDRPTKEVCGGAHIPQVAINNGNISTKETVQSMQKNVSMQLMKKLCFGKWEAISILDFTVFGRYRSEIDNGI